MVSRKADKIIIIGGSHAALAVIEALKSEDYPGRLTLISEEKVPIFSPTALPYLLWKAEKGAQTLRPASFYQTLELIEDRAASIDTDKSLVLLENGKKVRYDRLVIATGASAARLSVETSKRNPLLTLRRIEDLKRIEQRANKGRKALIIGAGLVGLHLAQLFADRGKDVHVVEVKNQILPGLVYPEVAKLLQNFYREKAIRFSLGVSLSKIDDGEAVLSNGQRVLCDFAVGAVGIKPNLELIEGTSIASREGILVNQCMETNIPGVYGCGDVAEYQDFFTGEARLNPNVISAAEEGRIVAGSLMGRRNPHQGLISINVFNCLGSTLFSLGRVTTDPGDTVFQEHDSSRRVFKRMIFNDGALKGMVLFNSPVDGGLYYRLLKERIPLAGQQEKIFRDPLLWGKRISQRIFKDH